MRGSFGLHVRAPAGTRIEQTEVYFQQVEDYIRQVIPANEIGVIIDNIGVPKSHHLALSDSVTVGTGDGEILVALNQPHRPTAEYLKMLREQLPHRFPDFEFFTQPADIVSQILNFRPARPDRHTSHGPAAGIRDELPASPSRSLRSSEAFRGAVDVHVQQILDAPRITIDNDRILAQQSGLTQRDVASSVLLSLAGSGATSTNFWLNYNRTA